VEEGERRHHIMANHGDIQPALSTCLWQLCIAELVVQYLWDRATMVMELARKVPEMRRMEECSWDECIATVIMINCHHFSIRSSSPYLHVFIITYSYTVWPLQDTIYKECTSFQRCKSATTLPTP